jgi:putative membrane protein
VSASPAGSRAEAIALASICGAALVASGIGAADRDTWLLEVVPVMVALPLLAFTYTRFRFCRIVYWLMFLHALILMLGGHYTYAKVPLGFWLQDWLALARNPYDRIGHFAQGFVPAMIAREVLLRQTPLKAGKMLFFLVTCVCLAISAFYELIEWWTAVALGASADAFLATQGDAWDTQWDMATALAGAIVAQALFGRFQDRALGFRR